MATLPIYIYVILICFLVSLTLFLKLRADHRYLRLFPPYLLLTLSIEIYGDYLFSQSKNNVPLYNFFSAFEIAFYLLILSILIRKPSFKRVLTFSSPLYMIFATANILFYQGVDRFHTISFSVGSLMIVFFCIYYFFELFRLMSSENLLSNPSFWIVTGILFFYSCGFPMYGLVDLWANISPFLRKNFTTIINMMNVFLYSLFTIGFLCIRIRKYIL